METALNPRAARRRAREQSYGPINNKSSETSGAIFHVSSLRIPRIGGRGEGGRWWMGESRIGDFPWGYSNILGGVRISIHARPFQPTNFINVSTTAAAAVTDVAARGQMGEEWRI